MTLQYKSKATLLGEISNHNVDNILISAAKYGRLGLIKYVWHHHRTKAKFRPVFAEAIRHGRLRIIRFLASKRLVPKTRHYFWDLCQLIEFNLPIQHLSGDKLMIMIRYLVAELKFNVKYQQSQILSAAVQSGNIPLVKYFIRQGCCFGHQSHHQLVLSAVKSGNADMLRYVFQNSFGRMDKILESEAMLVAAKSGYYSIVQAIVAQVQTEGHIIDNNNKVLHKALINGHIDIAEYLQSLGFRIGFYIYHTVIRAAARNYIQSLKFLLCNKTPQNIVSEDYFITAFSEASRNHATTVLEYFVDLLVQVSNGNSYDYYFTTLVSDHNIFLARLLLQAGAVTITKKNFVDIFCRVAWSYNSNQIMCLKFLQEVCQDVMDWREMRIVAKRALLSVHAEYCQEIKQYLLYLYGNATFPKSKLPFGSSLHQDIEYHNAIVTRSHLQRCAAKTYVARHENLPCPDMIPAQVYKTLHWASIVAYRPKRFNLSQIAAMTYVHHKLYLPPSEIVPGAVYDMLSQARRGYYC